MSAHRLSVLTLALPLFAAAGEPPLRWVRPAEFDPARPGLGLPLLPGVQHEVIHAPAASRAAVESGGDGRYESTGHGTYNHHTRAVLIGDKVVVYWTNHAQDENGPGQRVLARWGVLDATRTRIDWGEPAQRLVELAPAPVPVHRRVPLTATGIDRRYVKGTLVAQGGGLRFDGTMMLNHGWTDDMRVRMRGREPAPAEHFRAAPDSDAQNRYGRIFRYDMFWNVGPEFSQRWGFENGRLAPVSPLYLLEPPPAELSLTANERLVLAPLQPPYREAPRLAMLPAAQRAEWERPAAEPTTRPRYAPGTESLAADGRNALAHRAEFRRRDGTWVVVRDNLAHPGCYYAAAARPGALYPPAVRTNLFGDVMPAAGELPDGRIWLIGNNRARTDFFITMSDDGRTFDRTWLLLHLNRRWPEGFAKPAQGGPQYPFVLPIGDALWVFFSIGKEQIGAMRIPFAALNAS